MASRRPVPDYRVSNYGRIRSKTNRVGSPYVNDTGYVIHTMRDARGKTHTVKAHRLVAKAFLPMPTGLVRPQVNHIDGNKLNNHLSNLEWLSQADNIRHAFSTGLMPNNEERTNVKLTLQQAAGILHLRHEFSIPDLARLYDAPYSAVYHIVRGNTWRNLPRSATEQL